MAAMFKRCNDVGNSADPAPLCAEFTDVAWLNYADWLVLQDWGMLD